MFVNYMENIIPDDMVRKAVKKPPLEMEVQGPGNQIYYIQFEPFQILPESKDWTAEPYAEEKQRLKEYLALAKADEHQLTGEDIEAIPDSRFLVTGNTDNNARIANIISQMSGSHNYVFYVIGKNYMPNGMLIAEMLGCDTEGEYSSGTEAVLRIGADTYNIVRMSVSFMPVQDDCLHTWEVSWEYPAACRQKIRQIDMCTRCGESSEVKVPAPGHVDDNRDAACDSSGEVIAERITARQH